VRVFGHLHDAPRTISLAALISLLLGLFFTFVWAPHPWTWQGIDQYHDLARALARGEGFNTTDVPWGYAYYLAFFYALFGERLWLPILVQVVANATMPLMLFAIVQPLAGRRTAALAALVLGVFSFNTIYASTEMSDALASVAFLAAVWCFFRAHATGRVAWFALSGLLAGVAAQFRPNLLLLPALVAVVYVFVSIRLEADTTRTVHRGAVVVLCSIIPVVPWIVRNYQLAGVFLPTSSHGAIQLWYGSLQVGPYLENFSENPRAALAQAPVDYTSIVGMPIIVSVDASACSAEIRSALTLRYWTGRDPTRRSIDVRASDTQIPGQPDGTTVYWRIDPAPAEAAPSVYLVSTAHTNLDGKHPAALAVPQCLQGRVKLNDVFYRREIHNMRRYTALAMENIRREPFAFAAASAYRAVRLFIVRPASSGSATYKFAGADLVYFAGLLLSLTYFLLFLAGVAVAWRQRSPLLAFLVPIVYVPATICFVLTNQRYSVTVQPLMFAFIAFGIVTWWDGRRGPGVGARGVRA
jgi:4-amino-4-deoxy-L-arabinose transferase-like glycosyltransferase